MAGRELSPVPRNILGRLSEALDMSPTPRNRSNMPPTAATHAKTLHSACTLMVDLHHDRSTSAVVGLLDPRTRRYRFVSLPTGTWSGDPQIALHQAIRLALWEMGMDPEVPVRIP